MKDKSAMNAAEKLLSGLSFKELEELVNSADEFIESGSAGDTVLRRFAESVSGKKGVLVSVLLLYCLEIYRYATSEYRKRLEECEDELDERCEQIDELEMQMRNNGLHPNDRNHYRP